VNLRIIGCNYKTASVELREKLAFDDIKLNSATVELSARFGCEAAILSTCNRVELYVYRPPSVRPFDRPLAAEFLGEVHGLPAASIEPLLYEVADRAAISHLFRVVASLDSLVIGEGQIAGQVKRAFEDAKRLGTTGPMFHSLFPQALRAAKRVRSETGIGRGHISISSVAVDYLRQVFDRFDDKTILLIGAGKMARLTLTHLKELNPKRILVANRSEARAIEVAQQCGGTVLPWDMLDAGLIQADIAISTTGAQQPIVSRDRFARSVQPKRSSTLAVIDIAVPRDFDPNIHDGERVCIFNIDDLTRVRDQTIAARRRVIPQAESLVEFELAKFIEDWNRRKNGPVIQELYGEADRIRKEVLTPLLGKLNGKLADADRTQIELAFRQFQNKLLHGPVAALNDASRDRSDDAGGLLDAVRKLFGLKG